MKLTRPVLARPTVAAGGWRERSAAMVATSKTTRSKLPSTILEVLIDENSGELLYPDGISGARAVLPMAVENSNDFFALSFILLGDDRANVLSAVKQEPFMGIRFHKFGGSFISGYIASCSNKGLPIWHAAAVLQTVQRTSKGKVYFNPRLAAHPWGSFTGDAELMSVISARCNSAADAASEMSCGNRAPPTTPKRRF